MSSVLRSAIALACLVSCSTDEPKDEIDCEALSVDECGDHAGVCRAVSARPYDEVNDCKLPREDVGCVKEDQLCVDLAYYMVDENGLCWQFSNGCIPESFEVGGASCSTAELDPLVDC
jgi:hypothetical protein